jgi:hypothetical protein
MFAPVPIPGDPTVFGVSIVVGLLGDLFGGLFGGGPDIGAQLQQLATNMAKAVDTVKRFAWQIARALGKLLQAFHDIWVGFLSALWDIVKWLKRALLWVIQVGLPRLAQAIRNLRQLLNTIYKRYIRPALAYLQLVRKYLAILRLFHVPFADKLDRILVRIQGRIIGPYLYVLRTLNGIGNWTNIIIRADARIQRPVFINTMYAYQADWINMFWVGQQSTAGAALLPPSAPEAVSPTPEQVKADFQLWVETGGGPYAAVEAQALANVSQAQL